MSDKAELQQKVRASARALVPVLRERANDCEQARQVPAETFKDFADAGFFRILQPKKWGGYELDPHDFYDVQMIVAEGCMSSAWCLGVIAIHNWQMALFDDRAAQDVWGKDDTVLISSSYMPVGKVTKITPRGGYVDVEFTVDKDVKIPADAHAVTINTSILTDRQTRQVIRHVSRSQELHAAARATTRTATTTVASSSRRSYSIG